MTLLGVKLIILYLMNTALTNISMLGRTKLQIQHFQVKDQGWLHNFPDKVCTGYLRGNRYARLQAD
jgi:hypothetical protein